MDRRTLLGTLPFLALGGCVAAPAGGSGGGSDGHDGGGSDGDDGPTRVTERTLRDTGECADAESATVTVTGSRVRIEGCVTGPDGCSVARLASATVEGGRLRVVVGTESDAPPGTACTQALVQRGYVANVQTDAGEPTAVTVVHDAPGGRQTVAEWPGDS